MLALVLAFVGFASLDALNVLNIGVATAVVYDSRISRRSALPGGLSFIAGVFTVMTLFGLGTVTGLRVLNELVDMTPATQYWIKLVVGAVLIAIAIATFFTEPAPPAWASNISRRHPWSLALVGIVFGLGQAPTAVPYLTALTMLAATNPLPSFWPLLVVGYCLLAAQPPLAIVLLSTRRTPRARRVQRTIVRKLTRYGPTTIRAVFLCAGIALVANALLHRDLLL